MSKRWVIKESADIDLVRALSVALGISEVLANLLLQRDVDTFERAKKFFRPELDHLHDPFLMKDMKEAVTRIEKAISNNENILIYGDYDVDGTTAVALVYSFFSGFYKNVSYYIPDRYTEGYGISFKGIDYAADNDFSLIIALDCGIKSIDKVDYANEKKIDFIICDHHTVGEKLPRAAAVLDPKRNDCSYPYKELSGCGIGFKLAQAYSIKNNLPVKELYSYLDLVAVSIASDIVPITGENRVLAHYGLKKINEYPCCGIRALLKIAACERQLTITDVVFILGPRINSAGRIETGMSAVELLVSEDLDRAIESAKKINQHNTDRKGIDVQITAEAMQMIAEDPDHLNKKSTVLFSPQWHKGVIGIVASRVIEKHYKPTILLTESNGKATGSARSVKDYDVYSAIDACSDLLEQFGGHKYAAGLTLDVGKVAEFTARFEKIVSSTIPDHLLMPCAEFDCKLKLSDITDKFYRILKQFGPFGPGNLSPMFYTDGLKDKGNAKLVKDVHLKLDVHHPGDPKLSFSAIAFNQGHLYDKVVSGKSFDIGYHIEENTWNGNVTLQLNIKEIRVRE